MKKKLISPPKKNYNPLYCNMKSLTLKDIVKAWEPVVPDTNLTTTVPTTKIYFVRKIITTTPIMPESTPSINSIIQSCNNKLEFVKNATEKLTPSVIQRIEIITRCQSENEACNRFRKGL